MLKHLLMMGFFAAILLTYQSMHETRPDPIRKEAPKRLLKGEL
jgi:hypothetical protein